MYASREPINTDPSPYAEWAGEIVFDPRPEFDHVQHNEPNPILIAFRKDARMHGLAEALAYDWPDHWMWFQDYTDEMVTHARRVLTRLANLASTPHDTTRKD